MNRLSILEQKVLSLSQLELFVMGLASILDFITIKSVLGRKSMRLY